MAINDVAGQTVSCMYEIFFMNFWVIIFRPVFVHQNLKTFAKNLSFFHPWPRVGQTHIWIQNPLADSNPTWEHFL